MIPHVLSNDCLVVMTPNGKPVQVTKTNPNFCEVSALVIKASLTDEEASYLWELLEPVTTVRKILPDSTDVVLTISQGGTLQATIEGVEYKIPHNLATTIKRIYDAKGDLVPFMRFLTKLSNNPRKEVAEELWGFIQACGLVLQEDGNFLAYKNVNSDFTSAFDNKTKNNPGTTLRMRRQDVEHNASRVCSSGFHFAAWGYLQSYASGRKTVLLSISPENVVSIPTDYNNMKGRACEYTVLREVDQPEELKSKVYVNHNGY